MSTKKNKKIKHEIEKKEQISVEKKTVTDETTNSKRKIKEEPASECMESLKKKKRKIRVDLNENGNIDSVEHDLAAEIKQEIKNEVSEEPLEARTEQIQEKKKEVITWPTEDLNELIERMTKLIPANDTLAYSTRADKLEWDQVVFKDYSVEDCKKTWSLLQKKLRKFRLLNEVLTDAKEWVNKPKVVAANKKNKRHPDMPRRPLSSYLLYYLKKKDTVLSENPGMDGTEISKIIGSMYKNLTPEKKLKYEQLAAKGKEEYEEKIREFFETHPDFPRITKPGKPPKPPRPEKERVPKRPQTPFGFYFTAELQKENNPDVDKNAFKEVCKERWKQLSDNKKLTWINYAEAEHAKYEDALKNYIANHPDYVVNPSKPILTKEEISIKERIAGKPVKPPNSAYSLFSRIVLQSEEIKKIPARERLNFVSKQWSICSENDKKHYRELCGNMMEQYKLDFASYLESLPEDKRVLEIQNNVPKRRKSVCEDRKSPPKKKKKKSERRDRKQVSKVKFAEPEQPPISAFKYFTKIYQGTDPPTQAWKALNLEEKQKYEQELVKKKQEYIVEFERFLKSLTKEELEAFSNSRKQAQAQKSNDEDEDEDEEEEDDDEESSSGSEVESGDDEENHDGENSESE